MRQSLRVAVASRSFSRHPTLRAEMLARYPNTTFNDLGRSLSGQDLVEFLSGHEAAITALEKIDDAILTRLPELRVLSKYGVGYDMIDLNALRRRSIRFGWTGGVNKRSVAELVLSASIALLRCVPQASRNVVSGVWQQTVGRELTGRTFGIVGCGNVGKDVVRLLQPFNCRILAHDLVNFPDFYAQHDVVTGSLDQVVSQSDVVSLHLPLNRTTRGMFSGEVMRRMPVGSILLNMARGGLVDEVALTELLKVNHLGGAGLDVFEVEPPTNDELLSLPNVLVTPHIGGSSEEAILAMGRAAIDGIAKSAVPDAASIDIP